MPELPQIKKIRRNLSRNIINKTIVSLEVVEAKAIHASLALLNKKIRNSFFKSFEVQGRVLIGKLDCGYYIFFFLYSAGELIYASRAKVPVKHNLVIFGFKDGSRLYLSDRRRVAHLKLLDDKQRKRLLVQFGIQPLSRQFTYFVFLKLLRNKRTYLKNFLTNQKYISGIGNIYADEICFEARIKPDRGIKSLSTAEIKRLYKAIRKILIRAVQSTRVGLASSFKVYGQQGKNCPRCRQGLISKEKIGRKWIYYCPLCQH